jgi:hypothetical protein
LLVFFVVVIIVIPNRKHLINVTVPEFHEANPKSLVNARAIGMKVFPPFNGTYPGIRKELALTLAVQKLIDPDITYFILHQNGILLDKTKKRCPAQEVLCAVHSPVPPIWRFVDE